MKRGVTMAVCAAGAMAMGVLCSCVSNLKVQSAEKKEHHWIFPPLNEEYASYIGDSLIEEGTSNVSDAIILKETHGAVGVTSVHVEGTYKYIGVASKNINDSKGNAIGKYNVKVYQADGVMPGMVGTVYMQIYEKDDGTVYLNNAVKTQLKAGEYEKKNVIDVNDYYFKQELIYTGCDGKILKFTYREFADGTARPAFSVDATYDLSKGNSIRFKGAVLEISDYDNQMIKYKVVSGFKS